jgi:formate dehydrogenase beta subunit
MIVQRLRDIQKVHGYLPDVELVKLSRELGEPLYRLQEVASFFPHFRQDWNKPPYVEVKVCRDMACHLAGAAELIFAADSLRELAEEGRVVIEGASCLGRCDRAPAVCISRHVHNEGSNGAPRNSFHDRLYAGLTEKELKAIVQRVIRGETPAPTTDADRNVDRAGWQIDIYAVDPELKGKPYEVTKRYLKEFPEVVAIPDDIRRDAKKLPGFIKEKHPWLARLDLSGLQGMGGAGMKAYEKWRDVWSEPSEIKYIVCNGDESEPGTFKDRELLLQTPHLVVEGVILAGLVTGATRGYIYVRHEYHEQIECLKKEIERARIEGACGSKLCGTPRSFEVEVFESPGGYICGEQTALIEAMEDKRSQPRNRPPELQTNGLYDKPTVVNNVETLAWAPAIMHRGGEWYASIGAQFCKGRRFFSISGDLNKPGVFEVPNGTTLGELIALAGGVKGKALRAVATSGPSGGFLPAKMPVTKGVKDRLDKAVSRARDPLEGELLKKFGHEHLMVGDVEATTLEIIHLPLDLNFFRSVAGVIGLRDIEMMVGGGLVVYNETRNMLEQARNCTQFFRNESCGKCVPCRLGSQKLVEIGTELLRQRTKDALVLSDHDGAPTQIPQALWDKLPENLNDIAKYLRQTAICGLGYVAPNPLNTAMAFFPKDVIGRRPT